MILRVTILEDGGGMRSPSVFGVLLKRTRLRVEHPMHGSVGTVGVVIEGVGQQDLVCRLNIVRFECWVCPSLSVGLPAALHVGTTLEAGALRGGG